MIPDLYMNLALDEGTDMLVCSVTAGAVVIFAAAATQNPYVVVNAWILAAACVAFVVWFYRCPLVTQTPEMRDPDVCWAPSYGTVYDIREDSAAYTVVTFLSPTDVHMQYLPLDCVLQSQGYDHTGEFHVSWQLHKSDRNEKVVSVFAGSHHTVQVTQVAGRITRRIVNWMPVGEHGACGTIYGMIRLGSRVDTRIAKPCELLVKKGDTLRGGITRMALMAH